MMKKGATPLQKVGALSYVLFFTAGFYSWAIYGLLLYYGNIYVQTILALCVYLLCPLPCCVSLDIVTTPEADVQFAISFAGTVRTSGLVQAEKRLRQAVRHHS